MTPPIRPLASRQDVLDELDLERYRLRVLAARVPVSDAAGVRLGRLVDGTRVYVGRLEEQLAGMRA